MSDPIPALQSYFVRGVLIDLGRIGSASVMQGHIDAALDLVADHVVINGKDFRPVQWAIANAKGVDGALPLIKPTTRDTAYFGGIEINMCTWSGCR